MQQEIKKAGKYWLGYMKMDEGRLNYFGKGEKWIVLSVQKQCCITKKIYDRTVMFLIFQWYSMYVCVSQRQIQWQVLGTVKILFLTVIYTFLAGLRHFESLDPVISLLSVYRNNGTLLCFRWPGHASLLTELAICRVPGYMARPIRFDY